MLIVPIALPLILTGELKCKQNNANLFTIYLYADADFGKYVQLPYLGTQPNNIRAVNRYGCINICLP